MKTKRQEAICAIIKKYNVDTQSMLAQLLQEQGYAVTQTTVSRDIKELQLVKVPSQNGGYRYELPGADAADTSEYIDVFRKYIKDVRYSGQMVVIKTALGAAFLTAEAMDSMNYSHLLGTIAGTDTVFAAAESAEHAKSIYTELLGYSNGEKTV